MSDYVNYNPDVLSCLANLSNDEVFTPPEIANAMLDMLPQELFEDPKARFLDPACKTGVFLREIAKRLLKGLEKKIPDLQERIDHIFHEQLYAIAITELTAMMSRRSVYCTKAADSVYSVTSFENRDGNIRFQRTEHTWYSEEKDAKCVYCGASREQFDRGSELETHAYEFIHVEDIYKMKFDLIISNPPYQMSDGGGNGASATPIYQYFVQRAKKLRPRYMSMIIPARWYSGGKGLDDFRDETLHDNSFRIIHDFPDAGDVFPGVQIKAGVCYFIWERDNKGNCAVYTHLNNNVDGPVDRPLLEPGCDTFIRYNIAVNMLNKVRQQNEKSFMDYVSSRLPFGLPNTYKGNKTKTSKNDVPVYVSGNEKEYKGTLSYAPIKDITKGREMINWHKIFIGKAGSGSDSFPHPILPKPFYGEPNTACNESYLVIGPFNDKKTCENVMSYICTKFFRFMVLLKKASQNAPKGVYQFVPMQDFSKPWTDEELYKKYNLTEEEIAFIDSMIRPMDLNGEE